MNCIRPSLANQPRLIAELILATIADQPDTCDLGHESFPSASAILKLILSGRPTSLMSPSNRYGPRRFLFRHFETIAYSPESLEISRMAGIGFDLLAQPSDVDINGSQRHKSRLVPHRFEKLVARKHSSTMSCKVLE